MHGIPSNETSSTSFLLEKKKMKISSDLFNKDDFFQKKLSIYYIASFSELLLVIILLEHDINLEVHKEVLNYWHFLNRKDPMSIYCHLSNEEKFDKIEIYSKLAMLFVSRYRTD